MFRAPRARKVYKEKRPNPEFRDFVALYRFTPENVHWLADHFLGENEETRGGAITSFTKMKIFLRFVADPGFQTGIGEDIGVSQPTVSNTIKFVAQKIVEKADVWITFPKDEQGILNAKEKWQNKYRFPTAIGVIDCTHVKIKKINQNHHGNEYICRKNFPSINVQATCDAEELFTSVSAEWPGSVHDSRIWKNSAICRKLRSFNNAILLGDQGYGIENCLMTPFRNPVTVEEIAFNNLLKQERVIIERCFGQLKQRFPVLQNTVRVSLDLVPSVIVSCFILHNVSKYIKDNAVYDEEQYDNNGDEENELMNENDGEDQANGRRAEGQAKRRELAAVITQQL